MALVLVLCFGFASAGRLPERDMQQSQLQQPVAVKAYQPQRATSLAVAQTIPPHISPSPSLTMTADLAGLYTNLAGPSSHFYDARTQGISKVIPSIFQEDIPKIADVILVVDHTSSMGDDIDSLRVLLSDLQTTLRKQPGIRLGAVTFSDLKHRPTIGYRFLPLGKGAAALDDFFAQTPLIGSIEDMYGSIAKALEEFNWRQGVSRRLIVISDEAPAESPDSDFSADAVQRLCQDMEPEAVLHVILLEKQ